jgi:hypothetical protein
MEMRVEDSIEVVVAGSHLRWGEPWRRPQHILSRVARRVEIIYVEEPVLADEDRDAVVRPQAHVVVVTPHRVRWSDAIDRRTRDVVRREVGERAPLVWLYSPLMTGLAETWIDAPLVFDKTGDPVAARFARKAAWREPLVLAGADVAFVDGRTAHVSSLQNAGGVRCYRSGTDAAGWDAIERAMWRDIETALAPKRTERNPTRLTA